MMNRITAALTGLAAAWAMGAEGATVNIFTWNWLGATNNRPLTIRATQQPFYYTHTNATPNTTNVVYMTPVMKWPTNGVLSVTLLAANYELQFQGLSSVIAFTVPEGTNSYNLTELVSSGLYVMTNTAGFGLAVAAGANVTVVTNGRLYTVASTGGGSSAALTNNEARAVTLSSNLVVGGEMTGNGVGLTNLAADGLVEGAVATNVTVRGTLMAGDSDITLAHDIPLSALTNTWLQLGKIWGTGAEETDRMRVGSMQKWQGKYRLFYGGSAEILLSNYIVMAEGPNPMNLSRVGKVLLPAGGSAWDSGQVQGPCLYYESGTNYLYYFGGTNQDWETSPLEIGVAYATDADGTNFTRYSGNPLIHYYTAPWCATLWSPFLFKTNGIYYLFANASDVTSHETVGFWTATSPLGPFTAYAGNPVITNHHITADVSIIKVREGYAMNAHALPQVGQDIQMVTYFSTDLTNWTCVSTNGILGGNDDGNSPQSPRLFVDDDREVYITYDNGGDVWLARPVKADDYGSSQAGWTNMHGANIQAHTITSNAIELSTWQLITNNTGAGGVQTLDTSQFVGATTGTIKAGAIVTNLIMRGANTTSSNLAVKGTAASQPTLLIEEHSISGGNTLALTNVDEGGIFFRVTTAGQVVTLGQYTGNGAGLTNLAPGIATNSAVDGQILTATGSNLKWVTAAEGSGTTETLENGWGIAIVTNPATHFALSISNSYGTGITNRIEQATNGLVAADLWASPAELASATNNFNGTNLLDASVNSVKFDDVTYQWLTNLVGTGSLDWDTNQFNADDNIFKIKPRAQLTDIILTGTAGLATNNPVVGAVLTATSTNSATWLPSGNIPGANLVAGANLTLSTEVVGDVTNLTYSLQSTVTNAITFLGAVNMTNAIYWVGTAGGEPEGGVGVNTGPIRGVDIWAGDSGGEVVASFMTNGFTFSKGIDFTGKGATNLISSTGHRFADTNELTAATNGLVLKSEAQFGSVNLTNWSALATNTFYGLFQMGSVNGTNWGLLATNTFDLKYQTGDADLTNWALLATNTFDLKYQTGDADLTNWALLATNTFDLKYQTGSATLTNLATTDGSSLTNLTISATTNAIPALVLTMGKAYYTNIAANFSLAAFAGVDATLLKGCWLYVTNNSGADKTVTLPNGTATSDGAKVYYVTNNAARVFSIVTYGQLATNCSSAPMW